MAGATAALLGAAFDLTGHFFSARIRDGADATPARRRRPGASAVGLFVAWLLFLSNGWRRRGGCFRPCPALPPRAVPWPPAPSPRCLGRRPAPSRSLRRGRPGYGASLAHRCWRPSFDCIGAAGAPARLVGTQSPLRRGWRAGGCRAVPFHQVFLQARRAPRCGSRRRAAIDDGAPPSVAWGGVFAAISQEMSIKVIFFRDVMVIAATTEKRLPMSCSHVRES